MVIIFWLSLFLIFYAFVGYPLSLIVLNKCVKKDQLNLDGNYRPAVTMIIPAHNEEKVISEKLENLISLDYDYSKVQIIVASDNSTDSTNHLVSEFIVQNPEFNIVLYEVKERKGKLNAQNEAVKIATGEVLIFSDANSMLDKKAFNELVYYMSDKSVAYVSGKLQYTNHTENQTAESENTYWNYDLMMRQIESDLGSITAGNGAIYAIQKADYIDLNPIHSHDSMMPIKQLVRGKKAKYAPKAIAYEKAGETTGDEFKRKVRMSRTILSMSYQDLAKYNPFVTGWFSYFYFGHRYLRNSLWLLHIIAFISNAILVTSSPFYFLLFVGQITFYSLALIGIKVSNKIIHIAYYYSMTIFAQMKGSYNELTGKSKPFWEKAETTR